MVLREHSRSGHLLEFFTGKPPWQPVDQHLALDQLGMIPARENPFTLEMVELLLGKPIGQRRHPIGQIDVRDAWIHGLGLRLQCASKPGSRQRIGS